MTEERSTHPEEPEKKPRPWRPTNRQVFWAIGMVVTLMIIALLVVQLYPGLWEDVSREPVAMLKGRVATLIGIGVALTVLIVLLAKGSASLGWTGLRGKTLWDLLQLFIVPLVLVGIGLVFDLRQQQVEDQRAARERELAELRAQDEALQAYLDQMGSLLLERDLRTSEAYSEVRSLARARTLTVSSRLDPSRKTALMQFLVEAELVQRVDGRDPIISLEGANLSGANLSDADLEGAILWDAVLPNADLRRAHLSKAVMPNADLRVADLRGVLLGGAELPNADLTNADLSDAYLNNVVLAAADLPNADLSDAYLSGALLDSANLSRADLSGADLSGAREWTEDQLSEARTLKGATMPDGQTLKSANYPDGQTFKDWRKDKEDRQK